MPVIHLTTFIAAPAEVVFDLSRHVDVHTRSMAAYGEEAVAGIRFGMFEKDDTITWKAKHLFKQRYLRVKITDMERPLRFTGVQHSGDFKMMRHEHHFKPCENGTIMIDIFVYELPYGLAGRILGRLYLHKYILRLLQQRIRTIKEYAESDKWKRLLMK